MTSQPPPADQPGRAWRPSAPGPAPVAPTKTTVAGAVSHRGRKLFLLLVAIMALGGAIAAWLLYIRRFEEPFLLLIPITQYLDDRELPANGWGEQDSVLLRQHFSQSKKASNNAQERHKLQDLLKSLRDKKYEKYPAVIVYLCALGAHQGDQVFVLAGDAQRMNPDTWIPLSTVLDSLRHCPNSN